MKFSLFFLSILLLASCAAIKKTQVPAEKAAKTSVSSVAAGKYDESFDPLTLEDDDITIRKHNVPVAPQSSAIGKSAPDQTTNAVPDSLMTYKEADGYRVQIFAGRDIQAATMTETDARAVFTPKGLHVYLIFEAPFYKVRVGDFTDRNEAENARDLAKSLGYKSAFVVRSKVRVAQE